MRRPAALVTSLLLVAACSSRQAGAPRLDAGASGDDAAVQDAARPDASVSSFDCDPIDTGVFVMGNLLGPDGSLVRRVLGSYAPGSNAFTELADVGACVEGWYVRAMTVSRDGTAYFLLANQTLAAYDLTGGSCTVHPLARSIDSGLYDLATFIGDPAGPAHAERLLLTFGAIGA